MNASLRNLEPGQRRRPRLLFVGEGPHDIGRDRDPGGALAGFLHAAWRGPGAPTPRGDWPFEVRQVRKWTSLPLQQATAGNRQRRRFDQLMELEPDARRVLASLVVAATLNLDGVVVMRDCERADNLRLGNTLRSARSRYSNDPVDDRPACVIATPSRSHETWLLADGEAVQSVLGDQGGYHFSQSPEMRPNSDVLKRHLSAQAQRLRCAEVIIRERLAFAARPEELRRRCPRCYEGFEDDVQSELRRYL